MTTELEGVQANMHALQEQLQTLRTETTAIPHEIADLEASISVKQASQASAEATTMRAEADAAYRIEELTAGASHFAALGLAFTTEEGGKVTLQFTKVAAADPTRAFSVTVQVGDDDAFAAIACSPAIPDLAARIDTLNASKDFSAFVRGIRSAFKALA
jgi:chromosome segregation ATPase